MDEQMTEVIGDLAAERQYCPDIRSLRQNDPRRRLDRVVEMERGAQVLIKGPKRGGLRPIRVQNGQNVGDAPGAVEIKLLKPTDR